jgi:undecaprenyl-diphosphatase
MSFALFFSVRFILDGGMNPISLDHQIFHFINRDIANPLLDSILPIMTDLHKDPLFWLMVVSWTLIQIFLPAILDRPNFKDIAKVRAKRWAIGVLVLGLSMGLADFAAYRGVKIWIQRDRPEAVGLAPILRTHSHSGWSFPSNHAANNFALARTVQVLAPTYTIAAYTFATVVAVSRVYVGVHFPLDIAGGGLIGWLSATLVLFLARRSGALKNVGYSSRARTKGP